MAFLEFLDVSKIFNGVIALQDVNFGVKDGEFLALLGPSGSGKTTALRIIAGLETLTKGKIIINNKVMNDIPPWERDMGIVFQNYALFPHMDVRKNIGYGLKLRKLDKDRTNAKVLEVANMLEISDLLSRNIRQLSGGQQQRVSLARALAIEPTVLLMDEPLANLDARLRAKVRFELKVLQRKLGITTIYVTHDQDEAFALGDKVVVMNEGKVEQYGSPVDIYYNPKSAFVSSFIGKNNTIVEGRAVEVTADVIKVKVGEWRLESTNFDQSINIGQNVLRVQFWQRHFWGRK
jgi:ABC-type sugar transport system ATPase subunit